MAETIKIPLCLMLRDSEVKDLCNYVTKTGRIPVSVYSDNDYRELIVKPRSALGVNRRTRIKRKPIEL